MENEERINRSLISVWTSSLCCGFITLLQYEFKKPELSLTAMVYVIIAFISATILIYQLSKLLGKN